MVSTCSKTALNLSCSSKFFHGDPRVFFAGKWQETHSSNPGYLHGGSGTVPTGSGGPKLVQSLFGVDVDVVLDLVQASRFLSTLGRR